MRTGRTKEKIAIVVICMLSFAALRAQVTQKGIVLLQNSGSQPLGQVSILVSGAPPVASDSRGEFTLHFATRKAGDAVRTLNVSKTGYELVNTHDLELWNISSDNQFIVVMCPKGMLAESRRKYYRIGEDRYRKQYIEKVKELNKALEQHELIESEYKMKLAEANLQLQQAMDKLDSFCDRFARINRDMLTELDKRAMELLDKGDVEGAIRLYEEAQLLQKFQEKVKERDSIRNEKEFVKGKIEEEIRLLEKEGSGRSLMRLDSLRKLIGQD